MTLRSVCLTTTALGLAIAAGAPAMAATTGYSLGSNGSVLVKMTDLTNPTAVTGVALSNDVILNALAYRPNTNELYGFSQNTGTVYTVNTDNGQVSSVASLDASDPGVTVGEVGFDFNNLLDAARIVSTDDDNLVFFPNNTPANIGRVTSLAFNSGDVNENRDPSVFANAYTNQIPNALSTLQYVLDSEQDILATLDNNDGTVNTLGRLSIDGVNALDFSSAGGFDIFSTMAGDNTGYALLTTVSGEGLYRIDDFTPGGNGLVGATFLGSVGSDFGLLDGLAVYDDAMDLAPVPLPASALLLGGAFAAFGALRRRKSVAA